MKNTVLKFGVFSFLTAAGLFMLGLTLGDGLDYGVKEIIGYGTMVVSLIFVFFGIKHYRDQVNNGKISFGKAFLIGVLISIFAGLGIGIVDYIYTTTINPDFVQDYVTATLESMKEKLTPEEFEIQKAALLQQMETSGGSGFWAFIMFAMVFSIGLIISLISALILQRK